MLGDQHWDWRATVRNKMKTAFRNVFSSFYRSLNPKPYSSFYLLTPCAFPPIALVTSPLTFRNDAIRLLSGTSDYCSMAEAGTSPSVVKQFECFRSQLEESGGLRERVRSIATEIESTTRFMHANLLLVHQSRSVSGTPNCTSIYLNFFLFENCWM